MVENNRVLLTGATGFVGSHLAAALLGSKQAVHCLVRPGAHLERLSWLDGALHLHTWDGTTEGAIDLLRAVQPRGVFHLASLSTPAHSPDQVEPLIRANVLLGTQLLEAMSVAGVPSLVNAGTFWQHYESNGYRPSCLYAATKQAFEAILAYYVDAGAMRAVTLKLFDTYGPRDPRPRLFSLLRQAAATGIALDMSLGAQYIDLVYIDDVVAAFLQAETHLFASASHTHQTFGVSSGHPILLRDLVAAYGRALGKDIPVNWGARPYREREVMVPWRPAQILSGWSPTVGLDEGMNRMEGLIHRSEAAL